MYNYDGRFAGVLSGTNSDWSAMKTLGILLAVLTAAIICPVSDVFASEGHEAKRESFVVGFGAGWGNAGADLTTVEEVDRQNGVVGNLRLGWAVKNEMVFGVDFDIWSELSGDTRWIFNLSAATFTYFPFNKNAFIIGGVGIGTSRVEVAGGGTVEYQDQAGPGYFVGAGYEWWVVDEVAVGAQTKWAYLDMDGDVTKSADYFSIMLQLTWYKPKN